jgi:hypothetical protein
MRPKFGQEDGGDIEQGQNLGGLLQRPRIDSTNGNDGATCLSRDVKWWNWAGEVKSGMVGAQSRDNVSKDLTRSIPGVTSRQWMTMGLLSATHQGSPVGR